MSLVGMDVGILLLLRCFSTLLRRPVIDFRWSASRGALRRFLRAHSACEAFGSIGLGDLTTEATRNRMPLFQI